MLSTNIDQLSLKDDESQVSIEPASGLFNRRKEIEIQILEAATFHPRARKDSWFDTSTWVKDMWLTQSKRRWKKQEDK